MRQQPPRVTFDESVATHKASGRQRDDSTTSRRSFPRIALAKLNLARGRRLARPSGRHPEWLLRDKGETQGHTKAYVRDCKRGLLQMIRPAVTGEKTADGVALLNSLFDVSAPSRLSE
jgi:hypothetical protein